MVNFHIKQNPYSAEIRWEYEHNTWLISKDYTYDDPPVVEPATVMFHATPVGPITSSAARENARRWELASELCRMLDNVLLSVSDFADVTLAIEQDAISTAHFNTDGRAGGKRRVMIHVPH